MAAFELTGAIRPAHSVRVGDRFEENAVWSYETPYDEGKAYERYLVFYYDRMGQWFEDTEEMSKHQHTS